MIILLKGSRVECKRDSMEAASIEELYGPPVAVPFKWEESPGKAKPVEKDPVLRVEGSDEFYKKLLRKEGSMGWSSGSLYGTVAHGNVAFGWEEEPGKPKTPAREEQYSTLAPLSPPPCFHSPVRTNSLCSTERRSKTAPKLLAKKMMKWMSVGVSKPGSENNNRNSKHKSHESANSFDAASLGSDELGVSDSTSCNGSFSFKTSSVDDISEFRYDEACRIPDPASRCFARCPTPLPRGLFRSRNSVSDQKRGHGWNQDCIAKVNGSSRCG